MQYDLRNRLDSLLMERDHIKLDQTLADQINRGINIHRTWLGNFQPVIISSVGLMDPSSQMKLLKYVDHCKTTSRSEHNDDSRR